VGSKAERRKLRPPRVAKVVLPVGNKAARVGNPVSRVVSRGAKGAAAARAAGSKGKVARRVVLLAVDREAVEIRSR
jgi:hypothetical protein